MEPFRYEGRWALVTGASSGIGEAFARALAARGMNVLLAARRAELLEALASELARKHGVQALALPADLAVGAADLWARACADRDIDLVVNNAGFGLEGDAVELPIDRQLEMVRVNDLALLELCLLALPGMRARGRGGVINVSSIVGFVPVPGFATYAASKAFVLSLSESLWEEERHHGVRVVALCPGSVPTGFQGVAGSKVAGAGVRTPEQVVDAALHGLEAGAPTVVPGLPNQFAATAPRLFPRSLVTRVAGYVRSRIKNA